MYPTPSKASAVPAMPLVFLLETAVEVVLAVAAWLGVSPVRGVMFRAVLWNPPVEAAGACLVLVVEADRAVLFAGTVRVLDEAARRVVVRGAGVEDTEAWLAL